MLNRGSSYARELFTEAFEATVELDQVRNFAAAIFSTEPDIPVAFPIVWLAGPELTHILQREIGPNQMPLHEFQAFEYAAPLRIGARYRISAVALRKAMPERVVINADVQDLAGASILTMQTVLRIVPITGPR
jgi:hypothetical protein